MSARLFSAFLCAYGLLAAGTAGATTYYVSTSGSDGNAGTAQSAAFRSLQHAASIVQPGDTVYVMAGTYTSTDGGGSASAPVVYLTHGGTASAPVTFSAMPHTRPKLYVQGYGGFQFGTDSSNHAPAYIVINGFEIAGKNPSITLTYALANQSTDNSLKASCILVDGDGATLPYLPHHITIEYNIIHDCPGAGIAAVHADYLTITDNQVYNNALYSSDAQSGITLWQNWNSDNSTSIKIYILRNVVNNNQELVPNSSTGTITDGNGIIIDDANNSENGSTLGAYPGRTRIANNLVYSNGDYGITAFKSQHVDIVNNSTANNATNSIFNGEIEVGEVNDINILNNIVSAKTGGCITSAYSDTNTTFDYNIYYNHTTNPKYLNGNGYYYSTTAAMGPHDLNTAPLWTTFYGLRGNSPAVASGMIYSALGLDLYGNSRSQTQAYDRGAIGYVPLNGSYTIVNAVNQLGLDLGSYASGAPIIQTTAAGSPSQKWNIAPTSDGYFTIQNATSGLYIDSGASTAGTTPTDMPGSGLMPQKFELVPWGNSAFTIISAQNTSVSLDGQNGGTSGSSIAETGWNGSSSQEFRIKPN